jgi:hypothetical protein
MNLFLKKYLRGQAQVLRYVIVFQTQSPQVNGGGSEDRGSRRRFLACLPVFRGPAISGSAP